MPLQDSDKLIRVVQASTKNLLHSFRDKANALHDCSEDIKLLIRKGYDKVIAYRTAPPRARRARPRLEASRATPASRRVAAAA